MLTIDGNASRAAQVTQSQLVTEPSLACQSADGTCAETPSGGQVITPTISESRVLTDCSRFDFGLMDLPTANGGVNNHSLWYVPQLPASYGNAQLSATVNTQNGIYWGASSMAVPRDNIMASGRTNVNSLWSMQLTGALQSEEPVEKTASPEYIVASQLSQPSSGGIDLPKYEYPFHAGLSDSCASLPSEVYQPANRSLKGSFFVNSSPDAGPVVEALNVANDLRSYEDYFVKLDSGEFSELRYHLSHAHFPNSIVPAVSYNALSKVVRIRSHVQPLFLNALENFMMNTILKSGYPVFIDATPKTHEKRLEELEYCYQKMTHIYKGSRLSACSSLGVESEFSPARRELTTLFLNGYYENLNQLCQDAFTLLLDYHVKTVVVTAVKEYAPTFVQWYDAPLGKLSHDLDLGQTNSMMIDQAPEFQDFCKDFDWQAYEKTGLYTYNGEHLVGQLYNVVMIWKRLDNKGNYNCRSRIEFPITRKDVLENGKFGLRFDDMASPVKLNSAKIGCAEVDFDMEDCWRQMQRAIQMTAFERYIRGVRLMDNCFPTR
ncbi:hypothetical protein V1525DRAFT_68233 [Lipomyces kononenkoae]|uniref:Uncharacterized protein n=1 Tax=Lipomyces kononenkoae TaxID=34357 RepID=A0ACC3SRT9_LIPKO